MGKKGEGIISSIIYFVTCNVKVEIEAIKKIRPPNLLLSYFYFKKINLKDWCDNLGYKPNIMLDSGAYSAFNKGKSIDFKSYMNYIEINKNYIQYYFNLDEIGDPDISFWSYLVMKKKNFNPIPVFHYNENEKYLEHYIKRNEKYIALGGTVPEKNKTKIAEWINYIINKYPQIEFHHLGSTSKIILEKCIKLKSCDSSTWIIQAVMGNPSEIAEGMTFKAKQKRAEYNMSKLLKAQEYNNENCISFMCE